MGKPGEARDFQADGFGRVPAGGATRRDEPLIADIIAFEYESLLGAAEQREKLAWLHCRLWLLLLDGEHASARSTRLYLNDVAQSAGLDETLIEAIDAAVFESLVEVVARERRASRDRARVRNLFFATRQLGEFGREPASPAQGAAALRVAASKR